MKCAIRHGSKLHPLYIEVTTYATQSLTSTKTPELTNIFSSIIESIQNSFSYLFFTLTKICLTLSGNHRRHLFLYIRRFFHIVSLLMQTILGLLLGPYFYWFIAKSLHPHSYIRIKWKQFLPNHYIQVQLI